MRHLFIGIGLAISLWSSGAMAQSCALGHQDMFYAVSVRTTNAAMNINTWMINNPQSREIQSVREIRNEIFRVDDKLLHLTDLARIGALSRLEGLNSNSLSDKFLDFAVSILRQNLTAHRNMINRDLTRINNPYVIGEGRDVISALGDVLNVLRGCIAVDSPRR